MKWDLGRQKTGYKRLTLFNCKINLFKFYGFDTHIIKYDDGNFIPPHKDKVKFGKHHRMNIILWSSGGGEFICNNSKKFLWDKIIYFRPDIEEHSVSPCEGKRIVLSIGWLIL